MLTGLIPVTRGSATIFGEDITENIGEIRKNMGYCPQHDVLIPEMTVAEHLHLFASIKGCDPGEIPGEVDKMIESVGLVDKRDTYSRNLSGGQKRKLSLGIAFIGKSRIIFLDEPTSGMDPYSRRFTWNVIRKYREGRIIVLTTHFMDEADLLGDRIAIMANGKLRCCGSNLYLKQKYGVGYNMTLEKSDSNHFDSLAVLSLVKDFVPDCTVLTDVGAEMVIQLPFRSSGSFEEMFRSLDAKLTQIGIRSYGISATTLEEVFIRVAAGVAKENKSASQKINGDAVGTVENSKEESHHENAVATKADAAVVLGVDGIDKEEQAQGASVSPKFLSVEKYGEDESVTLFFTHVYALIEKRYYYFRKDSKSWVFQFLVPVIFVLIGMIVMKYTPILTEQPSIKVTTSMFNDDISSNILPYPYTANDTICPFDSDCSIEALSIDGQDEIMINVQDASSLPLEPLVSARSIYDMSYFLLENREDYKAARFGANSFFKIDKGNPGVNSGAISAVEYVVHANFTGVHAGPLFAHLVADSLVRLYDSAVSIRLRLHPLDETDREDTQYSSFNATNVILFLLLALPFIPASFAMFVVREKEIKSKHLQLVSGVSVPSYWIGTYIWDVATYMISAWLMIMVICVFPGTILLFMSLSAIYIPLIIFYFTDTELFTEGKKLGALIALFMLFGTAIAPFAYFLCFFMKNSSGTQTVVLFITFVTGLIIMIVGIVLRLIESTHDIYMNYLRFIFMLFPAHAFGDALNSMVIIDFYSIVELGGSDVYDVYDYNVAGYGLIFLAWESVAYLAIVIVVDYILNTPWALEFFSTKDNIPDNLSEEPRDIDVLEEENHVKSGFYDQGSPVTPIVLRDVKKIYNNETYAVRGVSLGIQNGECFGLLGVNGAG